MFKTTHLLSIGLILALGAPLGAAETPEVYTVSGAVQVTNTKLTTEGAKNQKAVVVYLEKIGEQKYPEPSDKPVVLDQKGLVFIPHVMVIQKGTTVEFLNSDTTDHNVFCVDDCCKIVEDINGKKAKFLDLGNFAGGQKASHTFNIPGESVMLCKLHPEMAAYIVVLETSYFAIAEIDGATQSAKFSIENVPAGKYVVKTWNQRVESAEQEIVVGNGSADDVKIDLKRKQRKRRRK